MDNKRSTEGFFGNIGAAFRGEIEKRRGDATALAFDILVFLVAFLFSRCHIVLGAYPLGLSFVAVLSRGVWLALIGSVIGSLTMGGTGIIRAITAIITVFLRVVISGGEKRGGTLFSEPLILRIASVSIGAFVGGAYEILLRGLTLRSVLYAVASVVLSASFTFAFAGIFDGKISFSEFLTARKNLFDKKQNKSSSLGIYLFETALLLFVFLISLSLKAYNIFGVSLAYVYSAFITLIVAKRFGAMRGMAAGFVSSFGISGLYSVAFALAGLVSGALFTAGITYALVLGALALSLWGIYAGGALGFLSVFPEYTAAALLCVPVLRKLPSVRESEEESENRAPYDMVSSVSLAYRVSRPRESVERLALALASASEPLSRACESESALCEEEYRDSVIECVGRFCPECRHYGDCIAETPAPYVEKIDLIARRLSGGERISTLDVGLIPRYCKRAGELFECITLSVGALTEGKYREREARSLAEAYSLFSRLLTEISEYNERETALNPTLTERLTEAVEELGLEGGALKVLGEKRRHIVIAAEDSDGKKISSDALRHTVEENIGARLGEPEFYKRGDVALLEVSEERAYKVDYATSSRCASGESVSGDVAVSFESDDGRFCSLIADGMGSGESAEETATLVANLSRALLSSPCAKNTALSMINSAMRTRSAETSSSLDLFDFDLYSGEAVFYKCGSAPSYVKRGSSIFRVRSETAPLGLMKNIDAERIRVEVKPGDVVIMLSDGVSETAEDSSWLVELLTKTAPEGVSDYADEILASAVEHRGDRDDMTVSVLSISVA